uniref:non-specific serine/threonine protein kinase n=1 Tax=Scophthalmus maximus TaxID=52904 RepID=A0A8D3BT00_SCOMX
HNMLPGNGYEWSPLRRDGRRDNEGWWLDFKVLTLLGKGSFACVYRAKSQKNGLEVAIKMIDKKAMHKAGMVQRVTNEVEIHCRLKHPSILELYNYFEDSNYVYLVLEMCHNGEMSRYLRERKVLFSEDEGQAQQLIMN